MHTQESTYALTLANDITFYDNRDNPMGLVRALAVYEQWHRHDGLTEYEIKQAIDEVLDEMATWDLE
jgi:hypothetical protein